MEKYIIDDSDENFLLNDDMMRGKSQIPRGEIIWTKKTNRNTNWGHSNNNALFNEASGPMISAIIEDHSDNLEDSPLLIDVSNYNFFRNSLSCSNNFFKFVYLTHW